MSEKENKNLFETDKKLLKKEDKTLKSIIMLIGIFFIYKTEFILKYEITKTIFFIILAISFYYMLYMIIDLKTYKDKYYKKESGKKSSIKRNK